MKISFSENKLFFNGNLVEFDHNIEEVLEIQDGIIVRLSAISKVSFDNIFCVDTSGGLKWRINVPGAGPEYQYYFTGMRLDGEVLRVGEFDGYSCKVNLQTGEVFDSEFTK